jgi:hypothetical protein
MDVKEVGRGLVLVRGGQDPAASFDDNGMPVRVP